MVNKAILQVVNIFAFIQSILFKCPHLNIAIGWVSTNRMDFQLLRHFQLLEGILFI
jgi:hypothetical protein